jgi:hypothetical protein
VHREKNIQPSLAVARDQHHLFVFDRFAPDDPAPATDDPVTQMKHRLTTQSGRALEEFQETRHPSFVSAKIIVKHGSENGSALGIIRDGIAQSVSFGTATHVRIQH